MLSFQRILHFRKYCRKQNMLQIAKEYNMIAKGLELYFNTSIYIDKEKVDSLPEREKNVWWSTFNHINLDSFNAIINSLDLILYGCRGDACALLRIIIEGQSFLEYGMRFDKMEEIRKCYVFGLEDKTLGVKRSQIFQKLDQKDNQDRTRCWKSLSDAGSHALSGRMQQNFVWDMFDGRISEVIGATCLSRREMMQDIIILLQLTGYFIENQLNFYRKYYDFIKDKNFFNKITKWLDNNNKIIQECIKEI